MAVQLCDVCKEQYDYKSDSIHLRTESDLHFNNTKYPTKLIIDFTYISPEADICVICMKKELLNIINNVKFN